jgi:hypothetical protein
MLRNSRPRPIFFRTPSQEAVNGRSYYVDGIVDEKDSRDLVLTEVRESIGIVTMNNPRTPNCLSSELAPAVQTT